MLNCPLYLSVWKRRVLIKYLYSLVKQKSGGKLCTKSKQLPAKPNCFSVQVSISIVPSKSCEKKILSCLTLAMLNAPTHLLSGYRTLISKPFKIQTFPSGLRDCLNLQFPWKMLSETGVAFLSQPKEIYASPCTVDSAK